MGEDDEGWRLGERFSIPTAGVPVPEEEDVPRESVPMALRDSDLLDELEPPDDLDLLAPDAGALDDEVDALGKVNRPPALPPVIARPAPPRAPLPVRRPAPPEPARVEDAGPDEPAVMFPPLSSDFPPGRGSGIDFEKVLATASMSPPPLSPAPTLDLVPSAPSVPAPSAAIDTGGGRGRMVLGLVVVGAAAFALAWWLRPMTSPPDALALGPIETAPSGAREPTSSRVDSPGAADVGERGREVGEPSHEPSSTAHADEPRVEPTAARVEEPTEPHVEEPHTTAPTQARPMEPRTTEPRTTEPRTTEPRTTEPRTTEPRTTEPRTTDPRTEARTTEPRTEPIVEPAPSPAVVPPPADLAEEPTREEVQAALTAVRPAVQACVQPGAQVRVRVTIANSGRVTTAVVEDDTWSRQPHGGCIARAVRTARFPPFARDRFVVVFPFQL